MQIQNAKRPGFVGNKLPAHKPTNEENSDFLGQITSPKTDNGFDAFGPRAPINVKNAWNKAAEQTGVSGLGIGDNGMMTHIPAVLVVQAEQNHFTGNSDVFGNTLESAKSAATKILNRLENPITPETNAKIRDMQENEKAFYKSFINNLNSPSRPASDHWKSYA